jgi:hypothetical protein
MKTGIEIEVNGAKWSINKWPDLKQPTLTRVSEEGHEIMARFKNDTAAEDFMEFLKIVAQASSFEERER